MLPVGHAAVGVLAYAGVQIPRDWRGLSVTGVVFAVVGSQLPDLIDKPLAYYALLPSGRSLAHSVFFVLALGLVLAAITPDRHRTAALAVWIGALSHLAADAHHVLLTGPVATLPGYLFWPLTAAPNYGPHPAPWVRVAHIYTDPVFATRTLALGAAATVVVLGVTTYELADTAR